ncbi:MAG: helix-turn-helix domain-containing protein [Deltaproteobacteria bacterium]|nr:helix-turn-helix domain-containing protein [Deltaproteobacteria bacterium]
MKHADPIALQKSIPLRSNGNAPGDPAIAKNNVAIRIGSRLKQVRKQSGLTQKRLAEGTGLSSALLSRIENGLTVPSIPTLEMITKTLKVEIGYFFKEDKGDRYIISSHAKRRVILSRSQNNQKPAYELELLTEGMKDPFMEPFILSAVGKEEEVEARTHDGQEFMYVLEGRIKLNLDGEVFLLKKGDAAYWNGVVPHKLTSVGKRVAKSLHVHLIPGRWTGTFQFEDRNRVG